MTKKQKGSKSDSSKGKKRSQATSSASSSVSHPITPSAEDIHQLTKEEDPNELTDQIDDNNATTAAEMVSESAAFSDEPTLTELIMLKVEGEKVNGRFEGFVVAYFVNGNIYEGMFSEGTMHGQGKFHWVDEGTFYEGDFHYNEITGKGKYNWSDGSYYEGDVVKGIRHGQGVYIHPSGKIYTGGWENGKRNGTGVMNYDNDGMSFYNGEWKNNVIEGEGIRRYSSGNTYVGEWYKGLRHGQGTMKWIDRNEQYMGQWKEGVQNGNGQHIWFVQRIKGSQYSMRNIYEGDFVNGKRHGYGIFIYPSGARYEGNWIENKKSGEGLFVFKNGRKYEGVFEDDKIKEFPDVSLSGRYTPDLNFIHMESLMQKDAENLSARFSECSLNTSSPSFQLYIDHILMDPRISNPEEETVQVGKAVMLHLVTLRKVYQFYSGLGEDISIDNTSVLNQLQFWRFLKDCQLHYERDGPTLADLDRVLAASGNRSPIHNANIEIMLLSFINCLISIAYFLYSKQYIDNYEEVNGQLLALCFTRMITERVLPNACNIGGTLFKENRKTEVALSYFNQLNEIYQEFCYPQKDEPFDLSMKMRDCLVIMKKLNLLNNQLTAKDIVDILAMDNPNVTDGQFVCLEIEITFYEFFELMMECATKFVSKSVIDSHLVRNSDDQIQDGDGQNGTKTAAITGTTRSEVDSDVLGFDQTTEAGGMLTHSRPQSSESTRDQPDASQANNNTIGQPGINAGRSSGKVASSKTKISSAESTNTRSRKTETEKTPSSKKPHKSGKSQKQSNSKGRRSSKDVEHTNIKSNEPAVVITDTSEHEAEFAEDMSEHQKKSFDTTDEEELDEDKKFNFWTHQIHIFFYNYLFPNAESYLMLSRKIKEKMQQELSVTKLEEQIKKQQLSNDQLGAEKERRMGSTDEDEVFEISSLADNKDGEDNSLSIIQEVPTDFEDREISVV